MNLSTKEVANVMAQPLPSSPVDAAAAPLSSAQKYRRSLVLAVYEHVDMSDRMWFLLLMVAIEQ
jgi:hypothetical protein